MPLPKDMAMDAPLGLLMCFTGARDGHEIAPLSRKELARAEQAYYERFYEPRASGSIWKTATAFLAPPIAALTAAISLMVYAMH
jgi:hypothetical protein